MHVENVIQYIRRHRLNIYNNNFGLSEKNCSLRLAYIDLYNNKHMIAYLPLVPFHFQQLNALIQYLCERYAKPNDNKLLSRICIAPLQEKLARGGALQLLHESLA